MSFLSVNPSQLYPALGSIAPQSIAAAGNATSPWLKVPASTKWLAINLLTGAGGGSVQLDVQQATSVGGAGAKAWSTALIVEPAAGKNDSAELSFDSLDINNGFSFVQVKATVTGGTGTLAAVSIETGPNPAAS